MPQRSFFGFLPRGLDCTGFFISIRLASWCRARHAGLSHCTMSAGNRPRKRRERVMCLLALFYRVVEDAAIVAGANREEGYARGGEPPHLLEGKYRAVAGTDPSHGGTWFGVNEQGVLIAVTNRPKSAAPPQPRSRGLLAL